MTTNDTDTRITLGDIEVGFNKKTGRPFTPEESVAIADAQKRMVEQWAEYRAQLQSGFASIGSQLQAAIAAPRTMLQAAMADVNKQLAAVVCEAAEPVRLLYVAADLYEALKADDSVIVTRMMASPDFGAPLLRLLVRWTEMNEEERVEELNKKKAKVDEKLNKIKNGHLSRGNAVDKKTFIDWCKNSNIIVGKIIEIKQVSGFPLKKDYSIDTLKKWYKKAMPEVKLSSGRPKIKN